MQEVDIKRMEGGLLIVAPNQSMKMAPFQSLVTSARSTMETMLMFPFYRDFPCGGPQQLVDEV